jgi:hypothetical protein
MEKFMHASSFLTLLVLVPLLAFASLASAQSGQVLTGAAAFADWKVDAPGVRRHIKRSDLQAPVTGAVPEKSIANNANMIEPPQGALPKVPDGFAVQVWTTTACGVDQLA